MYLLFYFIFFLSTYGNSEPIRGHNVSPANFQEFLFIASLGLKPSANLPQRLHFCTGSLISEKHVLTAAHCIENLSKDKVNVIVGNNDLKSATIMYDVDSWINYDDWASERNRTIKFSINDVAIVKLSTTDYQIGIEPVRFTNLKGQQLHGTKVVIAGWGRTNGGVMTNVLLKAPVTIMTHKQCENNLKLAFNKVIKVSKNILCSSADPYTFTDCGDSGGPVLDENRVIVGIIKGACPTLQWGNSSSEFMDQYRVNVHIDVSYYMDFIEDYANIKVRVPCFHRVR